MTTEERQQKIGEIIEKMTYPQRFPSATLHQCTEKIIALFDDASQQEVPSEKNRWWGSYPDEKLLPKIEPLGWNCGKSMEAVVWNKINELVERENKRNGYS